MRAIAIARCNRCAFLISSTVLSKIPIRSTQLGIFTKRTCIPNISGSCTIRKKNLIIVLIYIFIIFNPVFAGIPIKRAKGDIERPWHPHIFLHSKDIICSNGKQQRIFIRAKVSMDNRAKCALVCRHRIGKKNISPDIKARSCLRAHVHISAKIDITRKICRKIRGIPNHIQILSRKAVIRK